MKVRLIAITDPLIKEDCETGEELIAYAARVSNPTNQNNKETSARLLKYCANHGHWSIFEMVNVVFEITTTRDIAHQILRHRSFSFQEFSQRYAVSSGFELSTARLQDNKNRQNSIETDDDLLKTMWNEKQEAVLELSKSVYQWALDMGIAKEVARKVLPEGLTQTTMYMNGTLRSWITYIAVRERNDVQKEHREIALECKKIISEYFPSISEALGGQNMWNV